MDQRYDPRSNAGASSVIAFTLAVLVLWGNNLMVTATQSLLGQLFSTSSSLAPLFATWAIGGGVPAVAALVLASSAASNPQAREWERALARAALVLSAIAVFYIVVMLVGAVVHWD